MKAVSSLCALAISPVLLFFSISSAEARTEPGLTPWKLELTVPFFNNVGQGVYRRIGSNWDMGIGLQGTISTRTTSGNTTEPSPTPGEIRLTRDRGTSESIRISVGPEVRRWQAITDRLNTYCGLRVAVGYIWSDNEKNSAGQEGPATNTTRTSSLSHTFGSALVLGAEWRVSSHLGLATRLSPIGIGYSWGWYSYAHASTEYNTARRTHSDEFRVSWRMSPGLIAAINF